MKKIFIILSFILLTEYAVPQEQTDSDGQKEKKHHFGITWGSDISRVRKLYSGLSYYPDHANPISPEYISYYAAGSYFIGGFSLTSLHNLHKDWDIGFKIGRHFTGPYKSNPERNEYWNTTLIGAYGYYYPFEERFFVRLGLETNIYVLPPSGNRGYSNEFIYYKVEYRRNKKFDVRPALSVGVGYNFINVLLLNIEMSVPVPNEYGYHDYSVYNANLLDLPLGKYPVKLYYTLGVGIAYLLF